MGKNMNTCTYIDMLYIVVLWVHKHVQEKKNEYSLSSLNKIWTSQNLPARVLHFLQLLNPLHLLLGLHVSSEKTMIKIISRWTEKHISYISNSVILYNENEWCMFWSFHEKDYDVNSNKEKVTSSARLGGSQWWCVAEISQRRRSIATHKKGKHLSKIWWILIKTTSAPLNVFIRKWSRT